MLNAIKCKIKSLILISAIIASTHAAPGVTFGENDFLQESIKSQGWVKVRVWQEGSALESRRGEESWEWGPGHVSLETVDSYLSLWPTTRPTAGVDIWASPAGLVKGYSTDFIREGNRPPSHVFLLYLEESGTAAIRAMKEHYIRRYKAATQKTPDFVDELTDRVMWYSKGGPKPVERSLLLSSNVNIEEERQYYNCVSFVAVALAVADPKFLDMYQARYSGEKHEMIKACFDAYHNDAATVRQHGKTGARVTGILADIAAYFNNLVLPSDIVRILQDRDRMQPKLTETLKQMNIISTLAIGAPLGVDSLIKLYQGNQKDFWNKLGKLKFVDGRLQLEIEHERGIFEVKKSESKWWCALM